MECSGGEWSDLGESGVIWGRVEWFRGEWSDLAERGVVDPERLAETGHRNLCYSTAFLYVLALHCIFDCYLPVSRKL